jgi:hypothetical protein
MRWSSSTSAISSGEPVGAELLGEEAADLLVHHARFHVVADYRQEQVLGVQAGDLLFGDVAAADQSHLGQDAGPGPVERLLDIFELLRLEPVAPREQLQDQGLSSRLCEDADHENRRSVGGESSIQKGLRRVGVP